MQHFTNPACGIALLALFAAPALASSPEASEAHTHSYSQTIIDAAVPNWQMAAEIDHGVLIDIAYCGDQPTTIQAQLGPVTFVDPSWTGTWLDPNGEVLAASNGPIDPSSSPEGAYGYSFIDMDGVVNAVVVNVYFSMPGGSYSRSITVSPFTDPPFNPLDSLNGTPLILAGGAWYYTTVESAFLRHWPNNAQPIIDPANYSGSAIGLPMVDGYLIYVRGMPPCPPQVDTLFVNVQGSLNVGHTEKESEISIFPNPSSESITLHMSASNLGSVYRIIDSSGQVLHSGAVTADPFHVDVGWLSNGVYFVLVEGSGLLSAKFVKGQ